jgi:hypothetical protein
MRFFVIPVLRLFPVELLAIFVIFILPLALFAESLLRFFALSEVAAMSIL